MTRRLTVIKADESGERVRESPHPFTMRDLLGQADQALSAARVEAEKIIARARTDAEQIRRAAREEGHRTGVEEGRREGRKAGHDEALDAARKEFAERQGSLIESCRRMLALLDEERAGWIASARRDLVELALAVARRVAHHVGERDREVVTANLDEAVRIAGARCDMTLLVNAADAGSARRFAAALAEQQDKCKHVRVVESAEIAPGGCRVQWESGAVDAVLRTQLDRLEAELKGDLDPGGNTPAGAEQ